MSSFWPGLFRFTFIPYLHFAQFGSFFQISRFPKLCFLVVLGFFFQSWLISLTFQCLPCSVLAYLGVFIENPSATYDHKYYKYRSPVTVNTNWDQYHQTKHIAADHSLFLSVTACQCGWQFHKNRFSICVCL